MSALQTPHADVPAAAGEDDDRPLIGLVDYGMGNRRSVEKALEHVGARVLRCGDPQRLAPCAGLVVPGVGAFPRAMANLRRLGLADFLCERVARATPVLGICLGMQIAFERSSELGGAAGLGLIGGEVRELNAAGERLPHIGWNAVNFERQSPLREGLPPSADFYHVHSYVVAPTRAADVLASAEYGERFATAVQHGSFYGVQFHPEKSSRHGLALLANFVTICARRS